MANKVAGDGHVLKESSNTRENKMKGNTHIYINKILLEYY